MDRLTSRLRFAPQFSKFRTQCYLESEVELIDIVLVEDEGRSEEDVVASNLEIAQRAGLAGLVARLERARGKRVGGADGERAEVFGLPENHAVCHSFLDVA